MSKKNKIKTDMIKKKVTLNGSKKKDTSKVSKTDEFITIE